MPTALLTILAGLALLTLGRRLFWLFVGLVGFAVGVALAAQFVQGPEWQVLVIALAAGLVGILFALVLQQAALALAGFIAGAYVVMAVLPVSLLSGMRIRSVTLASVPPLCPGVPAAFITTKRPDGGDSSVGFGSASLPGRTKANRAR